MITFKIKAHVLLLFILIYCFELNGFNLDSLKKTTFIGKNDTIRARKLILIINELRNKGEYNLASKYCDDLLKISEKINYKEGEAISYRLKASVFFKMSDFKNSILHSKKATEICVKTNNYNELYKNYYNLGNIYMEQGFNQKALEYQLLALRIAEKRMDTITIGKLYNSIGIINDNLKNYDKALIYYNMALKIFSTLINSELVAGTYSNLGNCFNHKNNNDSAIIYYLRAENIYKKSNNNLGLAYICNNIGVVYSKKDDIKNALLYYKKSLLYTLPFNQKKIEATLYKNIGDLYIATNEYSLAQLNLEKALKINDTLNHIYGLMSTYKSLSSLYSEKKEPTRALEYYKKYIVIKDSIFGIESAKDINEKVIQYETEIKDKEIKLLNIEKQQKSDENKQKLATRNFIIILVISLALLTIFLIAYLYSRRESKNQKLFLRKLIQSQENERKRIAKELHDGIGQNLLIIKNNMINDKFLIENTIEELRAISRNLHPIQLERLGFKGAIEGIIFEVSRTYTIFWSYEIEDVSTLINDEQQINIYRIVQECISNIIKHSNATDARVMISRVKEIIRIVILDNGSGFDLTKAKKKKTLGISSIEERAKLINGILTISSTNTETKTEIVIKYG